jgi:type IV secretory pathway TraG/TraD family ATPase VirD4
VSPGAPGGLATLWTSLHGPLGLLLALAAPLAVLAAALVRSFDDRAMAWTRDRHRRGARVRLSRRYFTALRARGARAAVTLGGLRLATDDETRHIKIVGATGSGKSTAIRELLDGALDRGDRAVIADPGGGYLARYFEARRGDAVLNPFELVSARWNPFLELRDPWDAEELAAGLVSGSDDPSSREWRAYARTFVAAIAARRNRHDADAAELWRLVATAPAAELRELLAGTPAAPFVEEENGRMLASIRSVAGAAVAPLGHLRHRREAAFAVRCWLEQGSGCLFLPYGARQIAALRSLISTWLRLAIFEALSGPEKDRRLWFVIDELDALGTIDGLKDALVRLRKQGGRCVLGLQSVGQVAAVYGQDAQAIVENCGTTLILRCSASEHGGTAQFASRLIGEREVLRTQRARGRDRGRALVPGDSRRSLNESAQHVVETAVLPAEIEQLPDLVGFLKTPSRAAWQRVRLNP